MSFMPFILDRSPTAKLIKSIDTPDRGVDALEQLKEIMMHDILNMSYGYLDQAQRRASLVIPIAKDDAERDLLETIYMMAFRRIQRIHMESRP